MDWFELLAVQRTLKRLLQQNGSKGSILWHSAFFMVQLSHPYMTTGKTIALTRWTFVGKVMSLFFNMLSRLVITLLPRSKHLLNSWLQSPSAVILEPRKIKSATVSTVSHLFAKVSRRIKIIKIKAETNEKEMKETIAKINKTKSCFFEEINKIDKFLEAMLPW